MPRQIKFYGRMRPDGSGRDSGTYAVPDRLADKMHDEAAGRAAYRSAALRIETERRCVAKAERLIAHARELRREAARIRCAPITDFLE